VHFLTQNEKEAKKFRKKFRFIFVDEYQDTNDTQYNLLRLLAPEPEANLCVVGDANQSIYGFRGANASYIKRFTDDYPGAKVFRLTRSYRCSQTILSASSNVINQHSGFLEGLNEGVKISISEQPTGAAEAEFIARQIVEQVGGVSFFSIDSAVTSGEKTETITSLSDFAILCRTRNQFEAITKALLDHHVPYQEVGTAPFFRQEPFRSFADLLNALLFESWERAAPVFQLRKQLFSQLDFDLTRSEMKKSELIPFLNFLKENYFETGAFSAGEWHRFVRLAGKTNSAEELVQFLKLGLGTDTHDKKLEAVAVMTLHASKGLEFECVFIPGCENGLLPYNLYKSEVDEEEEKRLLYVGMTRARKLLYLTWARNRTLRGRKFNLPKSSFIQSIQEELIQQIKNKPRKKPEEKDNQLSLF